MGMTNNKPKRLWHLFILIALVSTVVAPAPGHAAQYCGDRFHGRTIHWIVPSAPGGGYDTYSRLIAPFYEKYTGGHVVVQNRSGAGGRIGAAQIMDAARDGLTVGILNGPGLMMAALYESTPVPNPATDFTILGRVAATPQVWAVAAESSLPGLQALLEKEQTRPVVFGTRGPGNTSFVDIVIASRILNLDVDIVTGYRGSRDDILGVLRGDVEVAAHSFGSLLDAFESGELRPWLQISDGRMSRNAIFDGVPWLAGPDGLAVRAARLAGRDVERASAEADALVELTGAGRLIAAPPGLDEELSRCMRDSVHAALTDPGFVKAAAAAGRQLEVARGEEAAARLRAVQPEVAGFVPELRRASEAYGK